MRIRGFNVIWRPDHTPKQDRFLGPGLFAAVPKTGNPNVPPAVVRLGSIPHGTTVLLQGTAAIAAAAPNVPNNGIKPFTAGQPNSAIDFPEQTLTNQANFRTSGNGPHGITQAYGQQPQQRPARGERGGPPAISLRHVGSMPDQHRRMR